MGGGRGVGCAGLFGGAAHGWCVLSPRPAWSVNLGMLFAASERYPTVRYALGGEGLWCGWGQQPGPTGARVQSRSTRTVTASEVASATKGLAGSSTWPAMGVHAPPAQRYSAV